MWLGIAHLRFIVAGKRWEDLSGKLGGDFDLALCIKRSDDTVRAAENLFDNLTKWSQPKMAKPVTERYGRGEPSGKKAAKGQSKGGSSDKRGELR